MAQYKQSEISNIFWACNDGFKGGRDPLGIQNSSIATYGELLPGLTNLTSHIRYYSLYCWLLSEYDNLDKSGKTTLHQYNFIRRAELAMALIMKNQGVGAVVGAMFVSQGRYKLTKEGLYNLADGADYDSIDKYWTFKSGAFGQYYLGSLIYFELVKMEDGRFYLRTKGKELADALRNSVKKSVRELFIECILDGTLAEEEIDDLLPLAIHNIIVRSDEWGYLNNLLTQTDAKSSLRRQTVYLLLNDLQNGVEVQDFVRNRFLQVCKDSAIQASFGWYFYFLCECLHYSIDSIFCLILNKIHDLRNPSMDILSKDIVKSISLVLEKANNYNTLKDWQENSKGKIDVLYDKLKNAIDTQDYIIASKYAITLMLRLYSEYGENKKSIREFENVYDLSRQRCILSEGLESFVGRYLSSSIPKYLELLIAQIMQEHTHIAIAKMGKNNSDLRKFIFEDGRIVLIEQRYPVETTPRVGSLYSFLQDMNYIDSDNNLTDIALHFILDYGKE